VKTIVRIEEYKRKQKQIIAKVLKLMINIQVTRNKGYSLRPDEESLIARLNTMKRDLAKPSVFRGRINELWAHLSQLKDANLLNEGLYSGSSSEGFYFFNKI
jgi:nuclear pore complex protein Nup54